ncbi:soma ferritin-like [Venturia canescens]|uniref:soma ferritin-like n=1 Tax=Venturia canescens TaxID=32260 RepID=UPI001C9BBE3D|nr:soma ferritin-like [Venturia canescens]
MIHRYIKSVSPLSKQFIALFLPRHCIIGKYLHRKNCNSSNPGDYCDGKEVKWPTGNRITFNFHPETEASFNQQINLEFKAFYYYLSMASYFGRVDVALPGCESFFTQMHEEEHEHALQCLNYIKMRGGKVDLCSIESPNDQDWKCPINAFKTALQLEIDITEQLVNLNTVATNHGDLNANDFIVTNFMESQMKSINEIAKFVTVLSGIGDQSLARFLFDKDLLENHVLPEFNVLKNKRSVHSTKK